MNYKILMSIESLLKIRLNQRPLWVISGPFDQYLLNVRFRAYTGRSI